jgi:hypothetical protein
MFTHSISAKPQQRPKNHRILVKNRCRFIAGDLKAFFLFFCFDFVTLTLTTIFVSASFLPKVPKVTEREAES